MHTRHIIVRSTQPAVRKICRSLLNMQAAIMQQGLAFTVHSACLWCPYVLHNFSPADEKLWKSWIADSSPLASGRELWAPPFLFKSILSDYSIWCMKRLIKYVRIIRQKSQNALPVIIYRNVNSKDKCHLCMIHTNVTLLAQWREDR